MYYSKEMTEKARAVIAGEIDIPCPIGWHTLYESNVLCAYACTLLRLPDAGIDADASPETIDAVIDLFVTENLSE